ncbi:sulfite exporter TauE/SafE family protein [Microvirga zambiensis]|uniref:sulfite exporter TauE/SafE family protein n=1 Tax=Microvirga zambiensis TaxID=1402137 RepID=UPI00191E1A40|nr:sulfite exporter TauE/SafE family protein [Microvirga zambiensis]
MSELEIKFYVVAVLSAITVGLSKGGLPVVGGMAVPVLALVISPIEAAGLLLPIYVVTDMFGLWSYRREYDRRNLQILVPATVLGISIGWAAASRVPEALVTLFVGVIGLAFCLNNWLRGSKSIAPRPADIPRGMFWGMLSGFTSFVSHSGGPPYQVYVLPQRLEKMIYAGTTTILFAIMNAVKLVPYWALGQLSWANFKVASILFPVGIAATFVGVRLVRVVPEKAFFHIVQIGLFLVSLKLIIDVISEQLG